MAKSANRQCCHHTEPDALAWLSVQTECTEEPEPAFRASKVSGCEKTHTKMQQEVRRTTQSLPPPCAKFGKSGVEGERARAQCDPDDDKHSQTFPCAKFGKSGVEGERARAQCDPDDDKHSQTFPCIPC